jgi:hypothetical protein
MSWFWFVRSEAQFWEEVRLLASAVMRGAHVERSAAQVASRVCVIFVMDFEAVKKEVEPWWMLGGVQLIDDWLMEEDAADWLEGEVKDRGKGLLV